MISLLPAIISFIIIFYPVATDIASVNHHQIESSIAWAANAGSPNKEAVKEEAAEIGTSYVVWVTAYSSAPEETDDTPFITAQGTPVRDGIIAANFLSFGTKVKIPELFGDRIFIVEDRMHSRKKNFVDIWMPTKQEAKEFGIYQTEIVALD